MFILGNVIEVTDRNSWKRWKELVEAYGPVSRLQGMFGVRFRTILPAASFILFCRSLKTRLLHISDPKAMYSVLIKDVELFPKQNAPSE